MWKYKVTIDEDESENLSIGKQLNDKHLESEGVFS